MSSSTSPLIVVDGYSTGGSYLPLIRARGLRALHVRSKASKAHGRFRKIADSMVAASASGYELLLDEGDDVQVLADRLASHSPVGVLVGHEAGVQLGDRLAWLLGLPGNEPSSTRLRRDKHAMHDALARAGMAHLKSFVTGSKPELLDWFAAGKGLPVVLKPMDSTGGDGVRVCRTEAELGMAFDRLLHARTFLGEIVSMVLAQEFVQGSELAVNTVSCRGRHRISDLWRFSRIITRDGRPVRDGARLVADFGSSSRQVLGYAMEVLDVLGIEFGPAHMEIMETCRGPVLLECGARPMWGAPPPSLLMEASGCAQPALVIDAVTDPDSFLQAPDSVRPLRKHLCVKHLVSTRCGWLESAPAEALLKNLSSMAGGIFSDPLGRPRLVPTVDRYSSPATLFLFHEDESVLLQDRQCISEIERDAESLLFGLSDANGLRPDPDWISRMPDGLWFKTEALALAEAGIIWEALGLAPGMEVLDCPCGDGRVGMHLARRGVRYTGMDINSRFVRQARRRFAIDGLQGVLAQGDMRELAYVERFDAIVNWFNSFGYYDVETDFMVLQRLVRALRPGGRVIVEAPNPDAVVADGEKTFDIDGRRIVKKWDGRAGRALYLADMPDADGRIVRVVGGARLYSAFEYRMLFRLAGLCLENVYDEALGSFTAHSARMLLVGRKGGDSERER